MAEQAEQQEVIFHSPGFILGVPSASAFGTCRVVVDAQQNVEVHPLTSASESVVEASEHEQSVIDVPQEPTPSDVPQNVIAVPSYSAYENGG